MIDYLHYSINAQKMVLRITIENAFYCKSFSSAENKSENTHLQTAIFAFSENYENDFPKIRSESAEKKTVFVYNPLQY